MSFVSLTFAVFFLVFVCLYHLCTRLKTNALLFQQILLFVASFAFYCASDLRFLPFLLYIIALSYFAGLYCKNKIAFIAFLIADLAPLLFFKYSKTHLIFPLGLSFFTFQSISYIADCFTGKIKSERNPFYVALFITFFPTISSGPIQRPSNLLPQLKSLHKFDYDNATDGMKLFAWGLFKKLCIADRIALYVNYVYLNASESHSVALLMEVLLYSFQIYTDFSGYSDMAIGVAKYLGFDAGKNFDHPYLSASIGEFWRKWHISLSSWLKDYVYIPLGGSRVALPRVYLNIVITFLVSGIWHGAGLTFVVWGLLHGAYQCVERAIKPLKEKIPCAVNVAITFVLASFAWIFFRAENMQTALLVIKGISHLANDILSLPTLKNSLGLKEALRTLFALDGANFGGITGMAECLFVLFIFVAIEFFSKNKNVLHSIKQKNAVVRWTGYYALSALFLFFFTTGISSNFIYNNF